MPEGRMLPEGKNLDQVEEGKIQLSLMRYIG
jgi:hypothetical protein